MEIRHVRVFLALSEELHFGRTAQRMRVAQSAVSHTIQALEAEVGVDLFARTRRRVSLTAAGREFVDYARRALAELERAAVAARHAASGETGRLSLRFVLMSALTPLPRVVARFRREHPRVSVHIETASTAEQLEAIRGERCDVGFIPRAAAKAATAPLAAELVERASVVAIVSRQHRLAARRAIGLADLAGEPFVFLKQAGEPQVRDAFRRRCLEAGFEPNVVIEVEQSEALLAFIAAGFGVSCAPSLIRRLNFRGVSTIPLRPAVDAGVSAVWHADRLSPVGHRFLAVLRAELARNLRRTGETTRSARSGAPRRDG